MNLNMRRQVHLRRFQMLYLRLELFREPVTLLGQQHRALYGQTVRRLKLRRLRRRLRPPPAEEAATCINVQFIFSKFTLWHS